MKKIFLFIGVMMMGLVSFGQDAQADVVSALKSADVSRLSDNFDDLLDVKLGDKPEIKNMGKVQAGIALKAFFADNGIKGFEQTSVREVQGMAYLTGKLVDGNKGRGITVLMKAKDGKMRIISVRIG